MYGCLDQTSCLGRARAGSREGVNLKPAAACCPASRMQARRVTLMPASRASVHDGVPFHLMLPSEETHLVSRNVEGVVPFSTCRSHHVFVTFVDSAGWRCCPPDDGRVAVQLAADILSGAPQRLCIYTNAGVTKQSQRASRGMLSVSPSGCTHRHYSGCIHLRLEICSGASPCINSGCSPQRSVVLSSHTLKASLYQPDTHIRVLPCPAPELPNGNCKSCWCSAHVSGTCCLI